MRSCICRGCCNMLHEDATKPASRAQSSRIVFCDVDFRDVDRFPHQHKLVVTICYLDCFRSWKICSRKESETARQLQIWVQVVQMCLHWIVVDFMQHPTVWILGRMLPRHSITWNPLGSRRLSPWLAGMFVVQFLCVVGSLLLRPNVAGSGRDPGVIWRDPLGSARVFAGSAPFWRPEMWKRSVIHCTRVPLI